MPAHIDRTSVNSSSPFEGAWLLLTVLAFGLLIKLFYNTFFGPLSKIPGPFYTRITNLELKWATLQGRKMYYLDSLHQKYGPIVRISPDEASVVDLAATREIHKITGGFKKTPWYKAFTNYGTNNMFTMIDVKEHSNRRRLLGQPLSDSALKAVRPLVMQKTKLAISKLKEQLEEEGHMDVLRWFHYMAIDIISDLSFGESFALLEAGKDNQYIQDMAKNDAYSGYVSELAPVFKLMSYSPYQPAIMNEMKETPRRLLSHARAALKTYKDLRETAPQKIENKPMLFAKMFKAQADGGLEENQIIAEAASNILGGGETVAVTLAYLIWLVSKSPDTQSKIAQELASIPDEFTYDEVRSLHYLEMVVRESMRLYNSVVGASLRRTVPEGGRSLAGYFIKQGVTVATLQFSLQRNPDIYVDPEVFIPERWEKPTPEMKEALLPFGLGTRSCVGLHLANMELRMAAVGFFKAFPQVIPSTTNGMSDEAMEMVNYFLVAPKGHKCLITVPGKS
ncbi:putative cytochrome P450 [Polychaeton citri CBS 116435]|uniref:Cytochrome P450 n=1 Tax=Polychaeton citri CBS 116435 TaxID=1314669 RepID=A0A9P4QGM4_9PEZI|nr:putative cytochrome P450 [Polychaeton citri CBS 116435]